MTGRTFIVVNKRHCAEGWFQPIAVADYMDSRKEYSRLHGTRSPKNQQLCRVLYQIECELLVSGLDTTIYIS